MPHTSKPQSWKPRQDYKFDSQCVKEEDGQPWETSTDTSPKDLRAVFTFPLLWPKKIFHDLFFTKTHTLPSANPCEEHGLATSVPSPVSSHSVPVQGQAFRGHLATIKPFCTTTHPSLTWNTCPDPQQKGNTEAKNLKNTEVIKKFRKKRLNSSRNSLPPQILLPVKQTSFLCECSPLFLWAQHLTQTSLRLTGIWKIMPYLPTIHRYTAAGGEVR